MHDERTHDSNANDTSSHDAMDSLQALYARLRARRPDVDARTLPHRIARELHADAAVLAAGMAAGRPSQSPRRAAPALGWALAAGVALAAVFGARQLAQEPGQPGGYVAPDARELVAQAPEPAPLFSGSFERGGRHDQAQSIFDSDFGS